ncbi:cytidylate kinase [Candidatus Daviesbacteria bacterium RIFCSPHIGHO2_12_FULL_37_11]|uniref:Cytidylate kinase n=1 Tax=Candidatus Daviesbacteria bacterium RIFCSPHIGHO2_12_FULL_37_11 TaxID=1797777 RepID=A0A1F5KDL0_9BACT|nr:MAG: cytidylate kinase [Candidatus Daviesbacteria bacterium RIFCSPHIGHO2_12_FULL_37_11]OGE44819.1 MAG: cytidylate kinase [Candidatus Daviesbacteria bacterium RIFCSPLOWO2_01_FULL_37_10]
MNQIITIDGPVSSGKNSVGHLLARKLGYHFIDTGSIYRIYTLYSLEKNYLVSDLEKIDIRFKTKSHDTLIYADGIEINNRLHEPKVTEFVSKIAANPEIRSISKRIQRQIGKPQNTVMTGRDIGTEIFPDASLKIFLTASPEVRAKRRYEQLKKTKPELTLMDVLNQIRERDKMDTEREASPMRIPEDAIILDNSYLNVEQTVEKILEHYK